MGNSQPGRFWAELPIAPPVPAAPFIQVGLLNAAAARAENVMGEDELVFGFALLERLLEPMVLRIAERDSPPVAILVSVMALLAVATSSVQTVVHQRGRVPVAIQDHEERVAPRPGIIVPQQSDGFQAARCRRCKSHRERAWENNGCGRFAAQTATSWRTSDWLKLNRDACS